MPNVKESLYSVLSSHSGLTALVGGKIYPRSRVDRDATDPYVTYFEVSRPDVRSLGGASGLIYPRFQIDVWDDDYARAESVASQINLAVTSASTFSAHRDGKHDIFEDETLENKTGVSQDFIIWFSNS